MLVLLFCDVQVQINQNKSCSEFSFGNRIIFVLQTVRFLACNSTGTFNDLSGKTSPKPII